ncbi:Quinol monooxygenase YgiN [Marinobacter daqiaonensis]|uniref:Quinol monooxygenase YgiN n=1 Tax=Marinobacter daqiaonensis TaxID=650891 RepID=A0A1I6IGQ5_9GAMM|nr:putative quinol monooxygenase [Marinobacter daqiaonensis]SFR65886.1 Quinol monooxygenase YgiN [Marinobacter daqiaonensis]
MLYIRAILHVKPEQRETLLEAARPCIDATLQEPGCQEYELHISLSDPNRLVFMEVWESEDCLEPHRKSDHMRAFGKVAAGCLAAPPRIEYITPAKVDVK